MIFRFGEFAYPPFLGFHWDTLDVLVIGVLVMAVCVFILSPIASLIGSIEQINYARRPDISPSLTNLQVFRYLFLAPTLWFIIYVPVLYYFYRVFWVFLEIAKLLLRFIIFLLT